MEPKWPDMENIKTMDSSEKVKQKRNYHKRHSVKELRVLIAGEKVWVSNLKRYGQVVGTNCKISCLDPLKQVNNMQCINESKLD